jgi:hypothetical protein
VPYLEESVPERSLTFPADSPDAMTVGAVDVSSYILEPYSSRGPTFGPGGTCSGGSTKPDIVGYANVSSVSYGAGGFNGTSAATPHVAGAAALVKDRFSSYTVSQLQNYLEDNAIDLGTPGKDNLYGAGRLYLPSSETGTCFYDDFETGVLNTDVWTTTTTYEGRVQVSATYPYSGTYSVLLDDDTDGSAVSEAALILPLTLAGATQVELDFWWREFGDEDDLEDGVFISDDDGASWHQALSFNGGPSTFTNAVVDIDAAATANGLTLNNQFQIKFQFYDDYSIPTDGYAIDTVDVKADIAGNCIGGGGPSGAVYLPVIMKKN